MWQAFSPTRLAGMVSTALVVLALAGCSENIVFVDREPFNPPPDAASGFLGYYTVSAKQTTCGNCHADFQAKWKQTRHASAYNTLAALPASQAQPACFNCHTVTSRGNAATSPSGWETVKDSAYRDVQCESCHGPGVKHVEAVGQGNVSVRPLAKIGLSGTGTCADCHAESGTHHPFVQQWEASKHAIADERQTRGSCAGCHGSRGAIARWSGESNYAEVNSSELLPVATCATCHAPHGSTNDHQLRLSVRDPDPDRNLCMSCHLRRVEPGTNSSRANTPHTAQGAVLLGYAGWRPPNFAYDTARIYGSHATTANPKLCAGCHVNSFSVTDPASGSKVFTSVGHQFEAVPCVDSRGIPTGETNCAFTTAARNWSSCVSSGCHASQAVAANLYNSSKQSLKFLADIIWTDVDGDLTVDPFPQDQGYLPRILVNAPGDLNPRDNVITAADGAEFNVRTCGVGHYDHEDGSYGAHNKFLCEALLSASAAYLKSTYGFLPAPPAGIQATWDRWTTRPVAASGAAQPIIRREPFPVMTP